MADASQTSDTSPNPPATAGSSDAFIGPQHAHDVENLVPDTLGRQIQTYIDDGLDPATAAKMSTHLGLSA